jgi:hypothetical protein
MPTTPSKSQSATPPSALSKPTLAKLVTLSAWARKQITTPPLKGEGYRELFRDSCRMIRADFTDSEIEEVLRARYSRYYRDIEEREYDDAIRNARGSKSGAPTPPFPAVNSRLVLDIVSRGGSLSSLAASSPVPDPHLLSTSDVIDRLFAPADLICFGDVNRHAVTQTREWFRGKESAYPFVVPNPMLALTGLTKDGRPSARCLSNSSITRHQVVEFDLGTFDEQAALLLEIASYGAPLRMVVYSGSKSYHGWYDINGLNAAGLVGLRRYAAALGCDTATFTACQLVRTPNALRDNGKIQKLIYLT